MNLFLYYQAMFALRSVDTGATTADIKVGASFFVGRANDANLHLAQPFISRKHAELRVDEALSSLVLLSHAAKHSQCVVHLNGAPCTSGASYPVGAGDVIAFAPKLCWTVVPVSVAPSPLRSSSSAVGAAPPTEPVSKRARSPVEDEGGASASAKRSKPQKGKGKKKAEEEGKDGVEDDADSAPVSAPAAPAAPAASEPDTPVGVTCPICCEPLAVAVTLSCGHALCHECAVGLQAHAARERVKCPECRQPHKGEARRCFALDGVAAAHAARALSPTSLGEWRERRARPAQDGRRGGLGRRAVAGVVVAGGASSLDDDSWEWAAVASSQRTSKARCAVIAMHIGIAPSGRAICVACRQPIQKGVARVYAEAGAEHGGDGRRHVNCLEPSIWKVQDEARGPPRRSFALRLLIDDGLQDRILRNGWRAEPLADRCAFMDALTSLRQQCLAGPRFFRSGHEGDPRGMVALSTRDFEGPNSSWRYENRHDRDADTRLTGLDSRDFNTIDDPPLGDDEAAAIASDESEQLRRILGRQPVNRLRGYLQNAHLNTSGPKAQVIERIIPHAIRSTLSPTNPSRRQGCRTEAHRIIEGVFEFREFRGDW